MPLSHATERGMDLRQVLRQLPAAGLDHTLAEPRVGRWLHAMVVIWWLHGGYMVVTWWLHGGYVHAPSGRRLANGGYMAVTWWLPGGYTVVTWRLHGGYMAVTWRLHGGYMAVTWWLAY